MAGSKVFVGNFSFSVNDEKLKEYFSEIGLVLSAKVMTEGYGKRSRGFGFVEFSAAEDAKKAIEKLDGSVWDGRAIKVSEDRTQRRFEGGARYGDGRWSEQSYRQGGHSQSGQSSQNGEESGYSDSGPPFSGGSGYRHGPVSYFRAQPFDLGIRRKRKLDPFLEDANLIIDYKDPKLLVRFLSERGRVLPRRMTGLSSANQRLMSRAIKRAQHLALLPFLVG